LGASVAMASDGDVLRSFASTQLMCVDMLQGLLEFGADPFVLEKTQFLVSG
jgi:hypothetical protein